MLDTDESFNSNRNTSTRKTRRHHVKKYQVYEQLFHYIHYYKNNHFIILIK